MIRINLLGEKKDKTPVYVLQIGAFLAVLLLLGSGLSVFHGGLAAKFDLLENEKVLLEAREKKLTERTKHVEELDKSRKLLTEKLITIARLKSKKQGPVRVLDDLTLSIPERAWLTSVEQKGDSLQLSGVALDPQTVSVFMGTLKNSKYFAGVDLIYSRQYLREGVKLQQFSLSARLTNMLDLQRRRQEENKEAAAKPEKI